MNLFKNFFTQRRRGAKCYNKFIRQKPSFRDKYLGFKNILSIVSCLFLAAALYAAPEAPKPEKAAKPDDFAGQMTISAQAGQLMYLELPENVYRHAERRDLRDIRVFDSGGTPVPSELRSVPRTEETPPPVALSFFPWTADEKDPGREAGKIEIDSSGTIIRVNPGSAVRIVTKEKSFLIDLSGLSYSPVSLVLDLEKTTRQWNSQAVLQYSGDLSVWRKSGDAQVLTGFGGAKGAPADKTTLKLPDGLKGSYILISLGEAVPPLRGVSATFKSVSRPSLVRESLFPGTKSQDGFSVTYAPGGYFPGTEIDFILPQADSLKIDIYCRYSEDDAWQAWNSGPLYLITSPERKKNAPWRGEANAPFWMIKSRGGLPFASVPEMRLVWEPLRVVFLARGAGDWILAYGNRNFGPTGEALPALRDQIPLAASVKGEERWKARQAEGVPAPWKQILLWSVLVLAVALLTTMAFFMARSMRKKG